MVLRKDKTRICISIRKELLEFMDELIEKDEYPSRSFIIEKALKEFKDNHYGGFFRRVVVK